MKEGKPKFENKGLVAVLCVLLVIAVGLGIGIGVVNNSKKEDNEVSEQEEDFNGGWVAYPEVQYFVAESPVLYTTGPDEGGGV